MDKIGSVTSRLHPTGGTPQVHSHPRDAPAGDACGMLLPVTGTRGCTLFFCLHLASSICYSLLPFCTSPLIIHTCIANHLPRYFQDIINIITFRIAFTISFVFAVALSSYYIFVDNLSYSNSSVDRLHIYNFLKQNFHVAIPLWTLARAIFSPVHRTANS